MLSDSQGREAKDCGVSRWQQTLLTVQPCRAAPRADGAGPGDPIKLGCFKDNPSCQGDQIQRFFSSRLRPTSPALGPALQDCTARGLCTVREWTLWMSPGRHPCRQVSWGGSRARHNYHRLHTFSPTSTRKMGACHGVLSIHSGIWKFCLRQCNTQSTARIHVLRYSHSSWHTKDHAPSAATNYSMPSTLLAWDGTPLQSSPILLYYGATFSLFVADKYWWNRERRKV